MRNLKKSGLFVLGSVVSALGAMTVSSLAVANEGVKIGTVSMQEALIRVKPGKEAQEQLKKAFDAKKTELQNEEASIKKMTDSFKKQSLAMSDEARGKKQAELQERIMKFQETTAQAQMQIQEKERQLTQPIIQNLKKAIQEVAKEKNYAVVLEGNGGVLYSLPQDDLTDEVIARFEKQSKK